MRVPSSRFGREFESMCEKIADCLQSDRPEACLDNGIYSACDRLPNGATLRITVRADDRKAHLCFTDSKGGRGCLTGDSLSQIKGTVQHLKAGPGQQENWVRDRLRDQRPTWCHVEAAA